MSSLHSLKSLRRARSKSAGQSKVFSSTDNLLAKRESNIHISNTKTIEPMRMLVNDEINLTPIEKGIRHSIALKLNVRANTIILECKYDLKDPLAEVRLNNIEMIYLKHGNTIPLLQGKSTSGYDATESSDTSIFSANTSSRATTTSSWQLQKGDVSKNKSSHGLSSEMFIQIDRTLMKGACLVDDNGSLYGILVHPSLKITKIDISRREYRNEMKKERTQLEDVLHVQWDEFEATVSREFMAGNDMETQGHNSFESGNVSVEQKQQQRRSRQSADEACNKIDRRLLAIGRTYIIHRK